MCVQALTAYQAGTLLVECFPFIPDIIMLMRELAISQAAPSSQELLTKGALRYAEKQGEADVKVTLRWRFLSVRFQKASLMEI